MKVPSICAITDADGTIELLFRLRDSEGFDKSNGTSHVLNLDKT